MDEVGLKTNLYFTYESRKLNMKHSVKLEIEIYKISRRRSRSPDNVKFGHSTLLIFRGRKEIYKDF